MDHSIYFRGGGWEITTKIFLEQQKQRKKIMHNGPKEKKIEQAIK